MQLEIVFRVAPNTFDSQGGRDGLFAEPTMMGVVPGSGGADEKKEAFKRGQPHHRLIQTSFKKELDKRILIDPPLPILQHLMNRTILYCQKFPMVILLESFCAYVELGNAEA